MKARRSVTNEIKDNDKTTVALLDIAHRPWTSQPNEASPVLGARRLEGQSGTTGLLLSAQLEAV
jgi:hypothetical protein